MKIRSGFVSNSSSASFVLKLNNLSPSQLLKINELIRDNNDDFEKEKYCIRIKYDMWFCDVSEEEIVGQTFMDNDELLEFFQSLEIPATEYSFKGRLLKMEVGKCYKHNKKKLYVKVIGTEWNGYLNIKYSDGRFGKLIPNAPGWKEISEKEWNND